MINTPATIQTELERLRNQKVVAILHAGNTRVMVTGDLTRPSTHSTQKWVIVGEDAHVAFPIDSVSQIRLESIPEIYLT